eukprot:comp20231_c0_seq1/m.25215 comp20231_c0_seq1/g.25215  ORF comp20231_c0_seq1/g.25215 comp20231_c0_seq1/m.25215 type:complete len:110 (+) comp20231_c0_seq1:2248-2577(+)
MFSGSVIDGTRSRSSSSRVLNSMRRFFSHWLRTALFFRTIFNGPPAHGPGMHRLNGPPKFPNYAANYSDFRINTLSVYLTIQGQKDNLLTANASRLRSKEFVRRNGFAT